MNLKKLVALFQETEKLKTVLRHSYLSSNRQESVAEHSWHLCLLAITFSDHLDVKVDLLRVLKMLIIHDIPEIITTDIPAHIKKDLDKKEINKKERLALAKLIQPLDKVQREEWLKLFDEFESGKTPEAKFAVALDKLEAVLQHNIADISTWDDGDFAVHPYYRNEVFDFDSFLREFKDFVDIQSMEKIESAQMLDRIDQKHVEKYKILKEKK